MASSGPNYATTTTDDSTVGTSTWTNPNNATTDDASAARANCTLGVQTHYLKAVGFGFAIPSGATINGIVLEVKWRRTSSAGTAKDTSVKLVKGGTISGTNLATSANITTAASTYAYRTWGSPSNLWGLSWTSTDINSATFGAAISALGAISGGFIDVDAIRITVYYTPATSVVEFACSAYGDSNAQANANRGVGVGVRIFAESDHKAETGRVITLSAHLQTFAGVEARYNIAYSPSAGLYGESSIDGRPAIRRGLSAGIYGDGDAQGRAARGGGAQARIYGDSNQAGRFSGTVGLSSRLYGGSNVSSSLNVGAGLSAGIYGDSAGTAQASASAGLSAQVYGNGDAQANANRGVGSGSALYGASNAQAPAGRRRGLSAGIYSASDTSGRLTGRVTFQIRLYGDSSAQERASLGASFGAQLGGESNATSRLYFFIRLVMNGRVVRIRASARLVRLSAQGRQWLVPRTDRTVTIQTRQR